MRIIKFRAWDGEFMFSPPADLSEPHNVATWLEAHSIYINELASVFMQFTGAKDMDGTEIYEGDILESSDGLLSRVYWDESTCSFMLMDIENAVEYPIKFTLSSTEGTSKVVGNIYQNRDLIKTINPDF